MLTLPAVLMHPQAQATLARLLAALPQQGPKVLVDAAALTEFDSSALAVLLDLRRHCLQKGQTLVCQALDPRLAALAKLYGIASLLQPE